MTLWLIRMIQGLRPRPHQSHGQHRIRVMPVTNDNHASSHHERPESELSNVTPHHDHQEYESHDGCPENDGWIVCVTPPDVWTDAQPRYPLVNRLEMP